MRKDLKIASMEDIACMKTFSDETGRASNKDYIDLYFYSKNPAA